MKALFDRVRTLDLSPAMPVAWPNMDYDPAADGEWPNPATDPLTRTQFLSVQFIPNTTTRELIGSDEPQRHIGLAQVSVYWPLNKGEAEPRDIAGAIADHFPADLRLIEDDVSVRITKRPDVTGMLVEESRVQIPVTIEYEAFI